jgi:hypothetical protein
MFNVVINIYKIAEVKSPEFLVQILCNVARKYVVSSAMNA